MLTVQTPQLNFNSDGIPCSQLFDDPYFSLANPLEESQHVFLDSTDVPGRWKNTHFTIAELGFGFGINFITTANAWIEKIQSNDQLHYISIEKYPVQPPDLIKCYQQLNLSCPVTESFLEQYPLPVSGFHHIELHQYNITLTLIFGEAIDCLKQCNFEADAWYLDGFSPKKNEALWSDPIAQQIHRLTRLSGTLSTYTAASEVRKSLTNAGFYIERKPGYGKKREMLIGTVTNKQARQTYKLKDKSWLINSHSKLNSKSAMVIGAGMAGTAMSAALAKRGWHVTLIDKNDSLASEGSGNANAILMPRLSANHDTQSQLTLIGFLYSLRYFNHLKNYSADFNWQQCGAIQIPRDETQWKRMQIIATQESIPELLLNPVSQQQASELANCSVASEGWHLPLAGWLTPSQLCSSLIGQYSDQINFQANIAIHSLERQGSQWVAYDNKQKEISRADTVVIANAYLANQFEQTDWCHIQPKRGQISLIPELHCNIRPSKIICADAYITPPINTQYVLGATFVSADTSIECRQSEHEENLMKLKKMIPSYVCKDIQSLKGRAAIRAVSFDRLPVVGPVADEISFNTRYKDAALGSTKGHYPEPRYHDGLYLASGFGSRGLAWIPLCSEVLACLINKEPSPISNNILNAIHPNRILMKNLIKRVQSSS
ncbi:MAG: bifunctional tRNA (5-methylaminomethyl-2-thiouridine)(34)-methyltransferase MnmD/FAD-dependent 5-carboxymethylaminomethyl-2-thiouridine(34) oxidoreductase MnmC [Gammaproteobacteria bacterium]